MQLPPIIERELRVALRRKQATQARIQAAGVAGTITLVFCGIEMLFDAGKSGLGPILFNFLLGVATYFAVARTFQLTADLFAEERRNKTLSLLLLTGISATEVFLSKLAGAVIMALYNLLAMLPFMAVPFLMGGVAWDSFVTAMIFLPNLLFFTLCVNIFASVACEDDGAASTIAYISGGIICFLTPLIYCGCVLFSGTAASRDWLLVSPAYGPYLVFTGFSGGSLDDFFMNSIITLSWSALFFIAAGMILRRTWQDDGLVSGRKLRERLRDWIRGSATWRAALRKRWLDGNPFIWLAIQDRRPVLFAWGVLIVLAVIWFLCLWFWPHGWPNVLNFFVTAFVLNTFTQWIIYFAAAKRIGEDRRSGALELLLTTPLSIEQIAEGQLTALTKQFRPLMIAVLWINVVLMAAGFAVRSWNELAILVYVFVWILILFLSGIAPLTSAPVKAMWIALNTGRPGYAVYKTFGFNWGFFGWVFLVRNKSLAGFPNGTLAEVLFIVVLFVVAVPLSGIAAGGDRWERMDQLKRLFRSIAQEPVPDPSDPRFKKWNVNRPFPMQPM